MKGFALDPRLENDSVSIMVTGLCDLRLSRYARWPWLILVPRRADITEIFERRQLED
ncbi:diadenosine tetraphosphate hydrolase, partial [Rhizobium leguminosarum]